MIGPQAKLLMAPLTASTLSTKLPSARAQPAMQIRASAMVRILRNRVFFMYNITLAIVCSSPGGTQKAPRPHVTHKGEALLRGTTLFHLHLAVRAS